MFVFTPTSKAAKASFLGRALSIMTLAAVATVGVVGIAAPASAEDFFTYTTDGSNHVTVTGCVSTCPTDLVIPSALGGNPVTSIGLMAFAQKSLASVSLPNSLVTISPGAFFMNSLSSVNLPSTLVTIDAGAFMYNALTSVTIPPSVTVIGARAFYTNYLTSLAIPNSVVSIGDSSFYMNRLATVTLGSGLTSIGPSAFAYNVLTSVTIPDSVLTLGATAFGDNLLTSLTFGTGLVSIGASAFRYNSLTSVTIPRSVTAVGARAFSFNTYLASFTFLGNAPTSGDFMFYSGGGGLTVIDVSSGTTGWGATWGGVTVRVNPVVPSAPTVGRATTSNLRMIVSFSAPRSTGGTDVTNYEYSLDGGSTWVTPNPPVTTSPLVVTGLTDGTEYSVQLRAVNSVGSGAASASTLATPVTTAGAPVIGSITAGDQQVSVSFSAPSSNGGTDVTNYEYSTDGGLTWALPNSAVTTSPLVITGLTNGTEYSVQLRAVNSVGSGAASASTLATPVTLPGEPDISLAHPISDGAVIYFTEPTSNGGSHVTAYEYSTDGGSTWVRPAASVTSSPLVITALTNGTEYSVRLRAVNGVGFGIASSVVKVTPNLFAYSTDANNEVTIEGCNGGCPSELVIPSMIGGNPVSTIKFGAFMGMGLSSVTVPSTVRSIEDYAFYDNSLTSMTFPPSVTLLGRSAFAYNLLTSIAFQGNAPADAGAFANNAGSASIIVTSGTSGWGATFSGIPVRVIYPASAPSIRTVKLGNGRVRLGIWAPRRNGGSEITGYEFTLDDGATWAAVDSASTAHSLLITGLDNGTRYVVKVRAVNGAGGGAASNARAVTPRTVADAPTITALTARDGSIKVEFEAPGSNGGSTITRYAYSVNGKQWFNWGASTSPQLIKALSNGVSCSIRLRALNAAGWGAASEAVEATPHR